MVGAHRLAATRLRFLSCFAVVVLAGAGPGCGLKGLAHDQLYGSADAADAADAEADQPISPERDADAGPEDASAELGTPDSAPDDTPGADAEVGAEVGPGDAALDAAGDPDASDVPPAACAPASCPSDQFCDDISGACLPRDGTGMISGAVYDACLRAPVNAKVGIAGRHACSAVGKGAYFFSNIPLGRLTVTAAAAGYQLFIQEVTIVPGGNTLNIALDRSAPLTCADPAPAAVACTCPEPTCVTP